MTLTKLLTTLTFYWLTLSPGVYLTLVAVDRHGDDALGAAADGVSSAECSCGQRADKRD